MPTELASPPSSWNNVPLGHPWSVTPPRPPDLYKWPINIGSVVAEHHLLSKVRELNLALISILKSQPSIPLTSNNLLLVLGLHWIPLPISILLAVTKLGSNCRKLSFRRRRRRKTWLCETTWMLRDQLFKWYFCIKTISNGTEDLAG